MEDDLIIRALRQVPEARLRLLELAQGLVREDGTFDYEKAAFLSQELETAIAEARAYAQATGEAVRCLRQIAPY